MKDRLIPRYLRIPVYLFASVTLAVTGSRIIGSQKKDGEPYLYAENQNALMLPFHVGFHIREMNGDGYIDIDNAFPSVPVISPNGEMLAYQDPGGGLYVSGVTGGSRQMVAPSSESSPAWSPRSGSLVFSVSENLHILNLKNHEDKQLTFDQNKGNYSASFSPDGKSLVYSKTWVVKDNNGDKIISEIYKLDFDSNKETLLSGEVEGMKGNPVWSPNGKEIAFTSGDGSLTNILYVKDLVRDSVRKITRDNFRVFSATYSNDGSYLAVSAQNPPQNSQDSDLYIVKNDGTDFKKLTNLPGYQGNPSWSKDNNKILFESIFRFRDYIYIVNSNGTDLRQISKKDNIAFPVWLH